MTIDGIYKYSKEEDYNTCMFICICLTILIRLQFCYSTTLATVRNVLYNQILTLFTIGDNDWYISKKKDEDEDENEKSENSSKSSSSKSSKTSSSKTSSGK